MTTTRSASRPMGDIMTDPSAQCATFGCGGITIPGYTAGVKTGTSDMNVVGPVWRRGPEHSDLPCTAAGQADPTASQTGNSCDASR